MILDLFPAPSRIWYICHKRYIVRRYINDSSTRRGYQKIGLRQATRKIPNISTIKTTILLLL